ncbi:hypothetical protein [Dyadobacter sp. CY323]|uniref:hypothetical protein n=1 Tax=Dyadobacter sp. CY323 TaxID=2907302 RepID=UPI001F233C7E|nr:hypothetical protein [Dyadobacter sp. CY323]MCE6990917.1 hypothetical protein [Dyadobacter sp. CY323]
MTKRTFVLFFCLAQMLASTLFSQQPAFACKLDIGTDSFSPYTVESSEDPGQFALIDDSICKEETIVRADDFEWKENLSDLLRHRHSTYRFLTLISEIGSEYYIAQIPKNIRESVSLPALPKGDIELPGYYGFLHRLCPF